MKPERRLHLVPPPSSSERGGGDEPPFSEEELREAEALRAELERGRDPLANALRAAHAPSALDEGDLDALVARALGDEDAPPTRLEQSAADALREGLERPGTIPDEHAIVGDLRAAWRPGQLDGERNEALIEAALARHAARPAGRVISFRRALPITMGALSGALALAAGLALMLQRAEAPMGPSTAAPPSLAVAARASLIRARSTDDLFDPAEKFPVSGEESARIDRIAIARASDLRQNRYAAWGVR